MPSRGVLQLPVLILTLVLSQGQAVTVTVDPSVDNSDCSSAQQLLSTGGVESTCRTVNDALGNVTCQSSCVVAAPGDMLDGIVIRLVNGVHRLTGGWVGCSPVRGRSRWMVLLLLSYSGQFFVSSLENLFVWFCSAPNMQPQ